MIGPEGPLEDCNRAFLKWPCSRKVALSPKQGRKIVQARRRIWVLRSQRLLADRQRPLKKRLRARDKSSWNLKQAREAIQARRCVGVLRSQRLLLDRQRPLIKWPCTGVIALGVKKGREAVSFVPPCQRWVSSSSDFSRIASARSKSGRAPAKSP